MKTCHVCKNPTASPYRDRKQILCRKCYEAKVTREMRESFNKLPIRASRQSGDVDLEYFLKRMLKDSKP